MQRHRRAVIGPVFNCQPAPGRKSRLQTGVPTGWRIAAKLGTPPLTAAMRLTTHRGSPGSSPAGMSGLIRSSTSAPGISPIRRLIHRLSATGASPTCPPVVPLDVLDERIDSTSTRTLRIIAEGWPRQPHRSSARTCGLESVSGHALDQLFDPCVPWTAQPMYIAHTRR
jgi:hypothetical protein